MSSRERVLTSINCREPDHIPLWNRGGIPYRYFDKLNRDIPWPNQFECIKQSLKLGVDDVVSINPSTSLQQDVKIRLRKEHPTTERYPLLIKEYETPKGILNKAVRQTPDWPYGDDIPFLDDYGVSSARSVKDWIENSKDLEALSYLFRDPTDREIETFKKQSERAKQFANKYEVPIVAHEVTHLGSAVMWLCGFVNGVLATIRKPEFLNQLLDIIHEWNMRTIRLITEIGDVDVIVHYGWYDSTDFWSPKAYETFLLPRMQKEIDLIHKHKVKFGYTIASGAMPLLGMFKEVGIDLLYGIDPVQGGFDMMHVKREIGDEICLWGGVNAHVTLELGTPDDIRKAVKDATSILSPRGGFILSSVGAIYPEVPAENTKVMIRAWQEMADYP